MNIYRFRFRVLASYFSAVLLALGSLMLTQGCSESIDPSSFAIAKEPTISDYLSSNTDYSQIKKIFDRVRLGRTGNASTLSSVLSARGNYTVFAPTNEALDKYLVQLLGEGATVDNLSDEQAQLVAYSCIIDNGTESAYDSPLFPSDGGAFAKGDLNDRSISCKEITDSTKQPAQTYFLINGTSRVTKTDAKLSNGYLHTVGSVIAPSNAAISDLIRATDNMRIMGTLLIATGWAEKMTEYIDQDYENEEHEDTYKAPRLATFNIAQHRYLGFTGFVETDDVFANEWGIPAPIYDEQTKQVTNADAIIAAVRAKCEPIYGTTAQNDLKDEDNAVNRFVAYHFMKGKVAHNQFVQHFNEWNYKYGDAKNPQQNKFSVDIWDYFVSLGKHCNLLKVTQDAASHNLYLNRTCEYDVNDNYKFKAAIRPGIQILANNEYKGKTLDNNARNGYFFPIKQILLMDQATADALGGERIRFDITTILPELLSYGCRAAKKYVYFPRLTTARANGTTGYFENISGESESTRLLYLHAAAVGGGGWRDYEGDELMVLGLYDFILKLPPVPRAGTYEIRMGMSNNTLRGMCQIYFGDDRNNLTPAGLPLDMRQFGKNNDNIGWVVDGKDAATNSENDKNMRNHGYMKAPRFYTATDGKGDSDLRNLGDGEILRRIITTEYMEPGKTYYLRFKSALNMSDAQFFSDYFEYVPKQIYNGNVAEDQW